MYFTDAVGNAHAVDRQKLACPRRIGNDRRRNGGIYGLRQHDITN